MFFDSVHVSSGGLLFAKKKKIKNRILEKKRKNHDQVAHTKRLITTFAVRVCVKPFNAYLRLTIQDYSPINSS